MSREVLVLFMRWLMLRGGYSLPDGGHVLYPFVVRSLEDGELLWRMWLRFSEEVEKEEILEGGYGIS